jgi:hypothetical protein
MFPFSVGKTFLERANHPITIPKEHNSQLIREIYGGEGQRELPAYIIPPKGRTLNGKIYYGVAGYGPYYQIKIMGAYPGWYLDDLRIGDVILVAVVKNGGKVQMKMVTSKQVQKLLD